MGSQLFNSRLAPRYATSFGIAMAFVGMAIIMNVITWAFTWPVDAEQGDISDWVEDLGN